MASPASLKIPRLKDELCRKSTKSGADSDSESIHYPEVSAKESEKSHAVCVDGIHGVLP